jgi:hypothetical protein
VPAQRAAQQPLPSSSPLLPPPSLSSFFMRARAPQFNGLRLARTPGSKSPAATTRRHRHSESDSDSSAISVTTRAHTQGRNRPPQPPGTATLNRSRIGVRFAEELESDFCDAEVRRGRARSQSPGQPEVTVDGQVRGSSRHFGAHDGVEAQRRREHEARMRNMRGILLEQMRGILLEQTTNERSFAKANPAKVEHPVPLGAWKYDADMSALGTPAEVRDNVWRSNVTAGAARACSKRIVQVTNAYCSFCGPAAPACVARSAFAAGD